MEMEYLTTSEAGSSIWDIENPISSHGERRRAEITTLVLQPKKNERILDVGCGDGYQMRYITEHTEFTVGIDISQNKLKEAKKRVKNVDFIRASSENIPFQPKTFDKILCLELFEHLRNPSRTTNEIDFILKKHGILVVSVPYKERITMTQCIHCGKFTPLWGHLNSFNEKTLSSLLPKNYALLNREYVATMVASHPIFSYLPTCAWKVVDRIVRVLPGEKPDWFINKFQKLD
jgi:ubiquinone/menaquinone biosynthesis C-methylase UbiE